MYVLGINDGHCATACLLKDGKILSCVSEERFSRIKNQSGFAKRAIDFTLRYANISPEDLDLVVFHCKNPIIFSYVYQNAPIAMKSYYTMYTLLSKLMFHFPQLVNPFFLAYRTSRPIAWKNLTKLRAKYVSQMLSQEINEQKIIAVDHHICHAYASYYGMPREEGEDVLVLTLDGWGDDYCGTVNVVHDGEFVRIAATPNINSLGWLYLTITKYLGMKPLEHEYKVMGLAPYAPKEGVEKSYEILKKLIWLKKDLSFCASLPSYAFHNFIRENLEGHRFDWIAGAVQKLTEELVVRWVKMAVRKTKISKLSLGGGVFMNVKLNMKINQLKEVEDFFIFPSCGDESAAIGAAYYGASYLSKLHGDNIRITPIKDLYLGPEFSDEEILQAFDENPRSKEFDIEKCSNIGETTAELLADNQVVARFDGKMEWGARALGNRSILARPSDRNIVHFINDAIKRRDFWMPFAPTILKEREQDYLINPKRTPAPYMILAFESTELGKRDFHAAIHPYDFTMRPQVLEENWNPAYFKIISCFEGKTGIGGVLNTSFNIHGEPIVCSPQDAMHVLQNSKLKHLAIGSYLVTKRC